jgi:IPT/TIG domain-containing protein
MRGRRHLVGVGAAVAVTSALVFAGSALAVTITSFTPVSGLAENQPYCPGGHVTLTGTGFVSDGGVTSVTVGGVPAVDVQVGSDSTVYLMVPRGAQTGPIVVTTKTGTASTASLPGGTNVTPIGEISLPRNVFTVLPCWGQSPNTTSTAASKPTVASFAPTSGKAGAKVTITGANLTGASAVKFGGTKATFQVVSATKITATVPTGAKSGKISVTTATGTATSSGSFKKL